MKTESIYNPEGNSFDERWAALNRVLDARKSVRNSKNYVDSQEWSNVLGSREQVEAAELVIEASLISASLDFEKSELHYAQEEGLLKGADLGVVMDARRRQAMDARRNEMATDENSQSKKRS